MVEKWDIFYVDLDPTRGSEQRGKRPVLVISNEGVNRFLPICTVIPFSSYKGEEKIFPTELLIYKDDSGLSKDSILMFQQIKTIDQSRFIQPKVGEIKNDSLKKEINNKIIEYFDL